MRSNIRSRYANGYKDTNQLKEGPPYRRQTELHRKMKENRETDGDTEGGFDMFKVKSSRQSE